MKGFTLIEVMITAAIVAILAAIAYPSYVGHVNKGRRVEAQAALTELAQSMERNYMLSLRYNQDSQGNAVNNAWLQAQIQNSSIANYYAFAFNNIAANAFTLSATPQGSQTNDSCGVLTLTNTGVRCVNNGASCTIGDPTARQAVEQCWR